MDKRVRQVIDEQVRAGAATLLTIDQIECVQFLDEERPIPLDDLTYSSEIGLYQKSKFPRLQEKQEKWGGKRKRAGRPRQYVRVPTQFHVERSEREKLTPESDLTVCIAESEMDENVTRRGIVIGEVWYGWSEALAIAEFVEQYRKWLSSSEP